MSLTFERLYPSLFALAAVALFWLCGWRLPGGQNFSSLLSSAICVSAILAGFLSTMNLILMALPTESVMGQLRASGYIDDLVSYIAQAFYGSIVFCVVNLSGFFLDLAVLAREFQLAWIAAFVVSTLTFIRVGRMLLKILRHSGSFP